MPDDDNDSTDTDTSAEDAEAQRLLAEAAAETDDDSAPDTGSGQGVDWKAEAEKWKALARRHEGRAKANADAASKAKTVEEQLAELRQSAAERDARDAERVAAHALDKVRAQLAENGIRHDDVSGLLGLVDTASLVRDGAPDDTAIGRLAESLTRVAGRATPDPDQGRGGGSGPVDMSALIRRAARRTSP